MATLTASAIIGYVSAAALLYLAAKLLRLGTRHNPGRVLGWFAGLWGLQVLAIRLALLAEPHSAARALQFASFAFLLPLPMVLAHFAAVFPRRLSVADQAWWPALLVLPSLAALAAFLWDARTIIDPGKSSVWGGWLVALIFVPFVLAMVAALSRVAVHCRRATADTGRNQCWLATLGWLTYLSSLSVGLLAGTPGDLEARLGPFGLLAYRGALALAALACGAAVWAAWPGCRNAGERAALLAGAVVPAGLSVFVNHVTADVDLSAMWRFLAVALIFYAVAKYRMFDLELRLRTTTRAAAAGGLGLLAWGVAAAFMGYLGSASSGPLLVAAGLGALGGLGAYRALGPWLDARFPYIRATEEYLLRRKLEVYRAALEGGTEPAQLDALAAELQLGPRERAALEGAAGAAPEGPGEGEELEQRYRVERELGRGLYGRILLAWDQRVGERVVLKEFSGFAGRGAVESFAREAKALGALEHPNVLAARDVVRSGADLYVVTEHAPDGSLEERLRAGPLALHEALDIAEQVLRGLGAAHRAGVVHRDVKPSNVLFKGNTAKLADFGVASDAVLDSALRAVGGGTGTVAWMSPEQARGEPAGPASDAYAMGALLYRMLAGRHYLSLEGLGEAAARRAIVGQSPGLPVAGVPDAVNAVLAKALAKDPASRYPHAGAVLRDLQKLARAAERAADRAAAGAAS